MCVDCPAGQFCLDVNIHLGVVLKWQISNLCLEQKDEPEAREHVWAEANFQMAKCWRKYNIGGEFIILLNHQPPVCRKQTKK